MLGLDQTSLEIQYPPEFKKWIVFQWNGRASINLLTLHYCLTPTKFKYLSWVM
ncbi:hypothetical protein LINPERHAP1_LOCUS5927 [Linum perenne]